MPGSSKHNQNWRVGPVSRLCSEGIFKTKTPFSYHGGIVVRIHLHTLHLSELCCWCSLSHCEVPEARTWVHVVAWEADSKSWFPPLSQSSPYSILFNPARFLNDTLMTATCKEMTGWGAQFADPGFVCVCLREREMMCVWCMCIVCAFVHAVYSMMHIGVHGMCNVCTTCGCEWCLQYVGVVCIWSSVCCGFGMSCMMYAMCVSCVHIVCVCHRSA